MIGINSAIRAADGGSAAEGAQAGSIGLGFAIPINQGKRVAEELINTGTATHPVIGVTLDMEYLGDGAKVNTEGEGGTPAVTEGGPGDEAGCPAGRRHHRGGRRTGPQRRGADREDPRPPARRPALPASDARG